MRIGFKTHFFAVPQLVAYAICSAAILLAACSFTKDKNQQAEARLNMNDTACLQDTKNIIANYLEGKDSLQHLDQMFDCIVKAVDTFTARAHGEASKDGYTFEELNSFLTYYFKDSDGVASKILSIGFEIKSTAIGGKKSNITRDEIEKVKKLVVELQKSAHIIDPHLDLLMGRVAPGEQVEPKRIDQAVQALNTVADNLSARFTGDEGTSLSIDRIFELVKLLRKKSADFAEEEGIQKDIATAQLFASNLKSILISGADNKIRCDEWGAVIQSISKMYGVFLRYKFGIADQQIGSGHTVEVVTPMMNDILSLVKSAVKRSDNNLIPAVKIRGLLENYEKLKGTLPLGIHLSSLDAMFPKTFTNILRPSRINIFKDTSVEEKNRELGIGDFETAALSYYIQNWIFGLQTADELMAGKDSQPLSAINAVLTNSLKQLDSHKPDPSSPEYVKWFVKRLISREYQVILSPKLRPLFYVKLSTPTPDANILAPMVGEPEQDPKFTLADLLRLNTRRLTVEIVLRSFAQDMNRARLVSGLTTDEAEAIYQDMRQVGFDLGVSDPRSQKAGNRTFMEANLFTSNSNGDEYIGYREGIEWFDFAAASGPHAIEVFNGAFDEWRLSHKMPSDAINDLDIFSRVKVDIGFFREHLKNNFSKYFSNLPGMSAYVEQLKKVNKYQAFEEALENASRPIGHVNDKMDSSAMRTLVPILYYTESIFTRYDHDHSGTLENDEAWEIFPIMKNTIRDVSNGAATSDQTQRMVFARLLLTGEPPPDDWKKYVATPVDWLKEKWYKPSIDRLGIINLIAAITATARNNSIKAIKAIYDQQKNSIQGQFARGEAVILDQLHELSRCSPNSGAHFRDLMQRQTNYIFAMAPNQKYTSDQFVQRLQKVIQGDVDPVDSRNGLSEQCQPMLLVK